MGGVMLNIRSVIVKKLNLNSYNTINTKVLGSKMIHQSSIIYSSYVKDILTNLENERLSKLKLIKYQENQIEEDLKSESLISSYEESFPDLVDKDGTKIPFNQPIGLFNGVRLIARFLEKKYDLEEGSTSAKKNR